MEREAAHTGYRGPKFAAGCRDRQLGTQMVMTCAWTGWEGREQEQDRELPRRAICRKKGTSCLGVF